MYDDNPTHRPQVTGYRGRYAFHETIVERLPDRTRLSPAWSRTLATHSRAFEWGYAGSGPAQLGLALLLDYTREERLAIEHYQAFTREVIVGFDGAWELSVERIDRVLAGLGAQVPRDGDRPSPERLDG
jgi:hypothetical protein